MARLGPRQRWSALGEVERVGLYTRQSLDVVLWGFCGLSLLSVALGHEERGEAVALVVGGGVVTALAHVVLLGVLPRFPAVPPPTWRRFGPLVLACVAFLALARAAWPQELRTAAIAVVIAGLTFSFGLLPGRRVLVALAVVGGLVGGIAGDEVGDVAAGVLLTAALLFTVRASLWILGIVTDLDVARRAQAQLAVAEERLRFSRDVHDVLGRRLSTIAVQSELAATLAHRGDERAADRMLEVRGVAHEALREARELARGYRQVDVANELEGARSLLRSAGIEVRLDVGTIPHAWQEPAAWVVRESVTNVLRHSAARSVEISYADGELRVSNDGAPRAERASDGDGLRSLQERLAPLGASLEARSDPGDRWTVVAGLPGSSPTAPGGEAVPRP